VSALFLFALPVACGGNSKDIDGGSFPPGCGDGTCAADESCTSCSTDCGICEGSCGDGDCDDSEDCSTCAADCGDCPTGCGDGDCAGTETCSMCPADCGLCPASDLRAFPTAEGFAAHTPGGRDPSTQILFVTNTNDGGDGSLRAALEASGPRIVIFKTGGTIELESSIEIRDPYLTLAGQTAPGGGIAIRNGSSDGSVLKLKAHDLIIRGIRVRPGPGGEPDGIWIDGSTNGHDIIIDHTSVSWAVDEDLSVTVGAYNVTVQWSVIAEGLRDSTHSNGFHSRGLLIGSSDSDTTTGVSVHHNLLAHNRRRMPFIQGNGVVDFVNNTIYDWGNDDSPMSYAGRINNDTEVNYAGNHVAAGPSSNDAYPIESTAGAPAIFVEGNFSAEYRTSDSDPEEQVVTPGDRDFIVGSRFDTPAVGSQSAAVARNLVLVHAGAIMPARDAADSRIVDDVINGTGSIIDDPSDVGGWPTLDQGTPPQDTDNDGMPDAFETANALDPNAPGDALGTDLSMAFTGVDGYLNIEVYINSLL
jgi:pectate lyase